MSQKNTCMMGGGVNLAILAVSLIVKDKSKISNSTVNLLIQEMFNFETQKNISGMLLCCEERPIRCEKTKPQAGMAKRLLFVCMS